MTLIRWIIYGVVAVALIGTGYWGYQEHQDKNSVLIKAENNYQRAFHDLNNNIANLEDELGKSIAINSRDLLAPCMANIWRIGYVAQSNLGQLPLTLAPFSKTERLLGQIANFTYDIGMRDLGVEPLSEEEWNQLKSLHNQAKEVRHQFHKLQTKVLNDQLRWMDVEMALAAQGQEADHIIVNGFKEIDKHVQGYIETEWGANENKFGDQVSDKKAMLRGKDVSEEEAKQKVREFLQLPQDVQIDVSNNGDGLEYTAYNLTFTLPERDTTLTVEVSKKGGHILWMLDSRDVEQAKIGLHDAQNNALQFLNDKGITSMVPVEADQYDNVGVFDFVYEQDGVRVYTDLIRMKVALDNGDILGYEALDYVVGHQQQKHIPKPKITLEEAKAKLNKNLKIMEEHLSIVEIKGGKEALCYELLGVIDQETYRIFVNALTGKEEKIEKMKQAQPIV